MEALQWFDTESAGVPHSLEEDTTSCPSIVGWLRLVRLLGSQAEVPRANDRVRTGDILLGKQVLYQLSYVRIKRHLAVMLRGV